MGWRNRCEERAGTVYQPVRQTDETASSLLKVDSFIRNDGKAAPPLFLCVLSGTEGFAYRRPDGAYVVPICMLGP